MTTPLDQKLNRQFGSIAISVPLIEDQIDRISDEIEATDDEERKTYLCATYQALRWALQPDDYAPPSEM
jgi:hypothetical protein